MKTLYPFYENVCRSTFECLKKRKEKHYNRCINTYFHIKYIDGPHMSVSLFKLFDLYPKKKKFQITQN